MKLKQTELSNLYNGIIIDRFVIDNESSDNLVKVFTVIDQPTELIIVHNNIDSFDWYNLDSLKHTDLNQNSNFKLYKKRHINICKNYKNFNINIIINNSNKSNTYAIQLLKDKLCSNIFIYTKQNNVDNVEKTKPELIGTEIFKKEINFKIMRIKQLKHFLKQNKKTIQLDINLTGLNKTQLIEIIKTIID